MGQLTTRVLAVLTTLALAIGLAAALSTSASAATTKTATTAATTTAKTVAPATQLAARRRINYGAITVNFRDLTDGFGNDKATKRRAIKASKRDCRRDSAHNRACKARVWVRNGCAAVAVRLNKAQTRVVKSRVAVRFTPRKAKRAAKRKVGRGARIYAYLCTTRYR